MLSSGFYNSKGGDRKYDAEQFGAMFNGLITDGVFAHYKDALKVTAGNGNRELVVKSGRAWFNGTWTEVDDRGHSVYLTGSAVETTYFVYLAINKSDRKNTIAWYSNIVNNDPEKGLYFYLLAQVTVPGGATKISDSMISDTRGSDLCPYVTGIMETVSFEELVKQVCGDRWQDWLGVYEAGITTGVQNAVAMSQHALNEVESVKAYATETEAVSYIWAKFDAVPTGGGGFEWATDSVHTELSDPPMPVCLFRDLSYADLGPGFKPNISLNVPYIADGGATAKAIPAVTQSKVWREYPYFWEGGGALGTNVLRYDDLQRVVVNVGGTASEKYRYRVSRLMHIPVTYEPGAYIGTVTADNATAYPKDGYKGGYYYMRFAALSEDVSFNCPDLSAKNVRDAIIEVARMGGNGSGTAMSVIEVEELPSTGIKGVFYIVKKPGDSDATEYLWLDRWEKVGGTSSGQNVELDTTLTQSGKAADAKATGEKIAEVERKIPTAGGAAVVLIRPDLCGCDLSNPVMLHASGTPYETTVNARDHHVVGSVYVEVGGVDVTKDVYDPETDTIAISAPVADVLIEAFCPEKQPEKTVDLVLFSGQSNMSGRGDGSIATVCPAGEGYWYKDGGLAQITGYFGNESNSTGSMVSSVAKAYFDSCGVPIVGVSHSFGGTPISQFVPGGGRYNQGVELYNAAVGYLETQGYTVRKKALVWNQGETDAENGLSQADYETAFLSMRDGLKTDCGITEFFLVEIGQHKTDSAMLSNIKAAQEHLTATEPDIIMASRKFVGAAGLMKDSWHYTQAAYNLVGRDTGIHMAYYHTTGIRPRTAVFSAADVTDQDTPVVNDELDSNEWSYKLYEDKGIVGLNQYIGSASDVTVKAQYKVDGVTYNTALDRSNKTGAWLGIFEGNTSIKNVTFEDGIIWMNNGGASVNFAEAMFKGCTALETVVNIPPMLEGGSVSNRSAEAMYYGCKALVSADIPLNAVNAKQAFYGCGALTEYAEIPSTVTDAWAMFQHAGIVHCPDIPATVTGCTQMFAAVNKAESAGVIRANTTSIRSLFYQQELLAGTVRIESSDIADMTSAFAPAAIPNITFEVPADSTTYSTLMAAYPTANVTTF